MPNFLARKKTVWLSNNRLHECVSEVIKYPKLVASSTYLEGKSSVPREHEGSPGRTRGTDLYDPLVRGVVAPRLDASVTSW